jgi:hypothetical protein
MVLPVATCHDARHFRGFPLPLAGGSRFLIGLDTVGSTDDYDDYGKNIWITFQSVVVHRVKPLTRRPQLHPYHHPCPL